MEASSKIGLPRALIIPALALLLALLLISSRQFNAALSNAFPEVIGGEYLFNGFRTITIIFGLSCLPGALIGSVIGYLLAWNLRIALAIRNVLRIAQWAPFILWWGLDTALFIASRQKPPGSFFFWTIALPAVTTGSCFHFLSARLRLQCDWSNCVAEAAKLAVFRALFISLVMSLVIWLPIWAIPANPHTARHHVAVVTVAILLALVHWTYRSDIDCNASSHREFLDADMSSPNGASWWATIGVYLFMLVAWQVIANLDYFNATPARTLLAAIKLIAAADLWRDMLTSLSEIFSGIIFSGILVLVISATLLKRLSSAKCLLSILSLTFALPIIIWPTWFGWLLSWGTQSNTLVWHVTCVACLTFYPLLSTYWTLRDKPAFYRTLLAIEQALPYGFVAILYSEMMAATSGLVFSIVVAVADNQTEKAFAIFLITLSLMLVLSLVFRLLARKSDLFMRSDVFPEPGVMKPSNST